MTSPRLFRGLQAIAVPPRRAVVTVGMFDGVHIAHQQLIRLTTRLARRLRGTSVVITFDPDPQLVLDPSHAPPTLMPLEVRASFLQALGVDWVWIIPFTKRFSRMSAEQFVQRILVRQLRASALIVGEGFVFGRNRRGDMDVLRTLGAQCGMRIIPVRPIRRDGTPVSSSRIRTLISHGDLTQARRLLGRNPELYGSVVRGAGRGRRLGFPTVNLQLVSHVLPPQGVYAVMVRTADGTRSWRGVTPPPSSVRGQRTVSHLEFARGKLLGGGVMNLGVRPTFGPGSLVCEVHLLRCTGTLRGRSVSVSLVARLRSERCFSSPQALVHQIRRDVTRARRFLAHRCS